MKRTALALLGTLLLLSACSGSHRPTYSGHEENTRGVPGFVNGKKVSPNVKLGQSYTVDGETYVPRHQPDYVEEGMASWYGPGFHGGATANGEEYDTGEMTAAHRTLPLPSIVRVTSLDTGKSAYVRINDRGPFAKGRIIDLSRSAATKIGMVGKGVGRVRVEYLPLESQRFTDLLAEGRDPKSIDVENEVIGKQPTWVANDIRPAAPGVAMASNQPRSVAPASHDKNISSWVSRLNPISTANAADAPVADAAVADVAAGSDSSDISTRDLPPPAGVAAVAQKNVASPFAPVDGAPVASAKPVVADVAQAAPKVVTNDIQTEPVKPATDPPRPPMVDPPQGVSKPPASDLSRAPPQVVATSPPGVAAAASQGQMIQLGAFMQQANAEHLRAKVSSLGKVVIVTKQAPAGGTLFLVRMGPYAHVDESRTMLAQLAKLGINPRLVSP